MFNTVFAMPTKTNDEIIADYPFTNRVNELSVSEKQEITKTLTACADVMRFNIRNYNYDKLFKYVLYTHKNFQILTDIPFVLHHPVFELPEKRLNILRWLQ